MIRTLYEIINAKLTKKLMNSQRQNLICQKSDYLKDCTKDINIFQETKSNTFHVQGHFFCFDMRNEKKSLKW